MWPSTRGAPELLLPCSSQRLLLFRVWQGMVAEVDVDRFPLPAPAPYYHYQVSPAGVEGRTWALPLLSPAKPSTLSNCSLRPMAGARQARLWGSPYLQFSWGQWQWRGWFPPLLLLCACSLPSSLLSPAKDGVPQPFLSPGSIYIFSPSSWCIQQFIFQICWDFFSFRKAPPPLLKPCPYPIISLLTFHCILDSWLSDFGLLP